MQRVAVAAAPAAVDDAAALAAVGVDHAAVAALAAAVADFAADSVDPAAAAAAVVVVVVQAMIAAGFEHRRATRCQCATGLPQFCLAEIGRSQLRCPSFPASPASMSACSCYPLVDPVDVRRYSDIESRSIDREDTGSRLDILSWTCCSCHKPHATVTVACSSLSHHCHCHCHCRSH